VDASFERNHGRSPLGSRRLRTTRRHPARTPELQHGSTPLIPSDAQAPAVGLTNAQLVADCFHIVKLANKPLATSVAIGAALNFEACATPSDR
jgi:hypothetical protein